MWKLGCLKSLMLYKQYEFGQYWLISTTVFSKEKHFMELIHFKPKEAWEWFYIFYITVRKYEDILLYH